MDKPIRLSMHAAQQVTRRGSSYQEVADVIRTSAWMPAKRGKGRQECTKDFAYNAIWNGNPYAIKQVRPIFVDNPDEIVVVTVYIYYR